MNVSFGDHEDKFVYVDVLHYENAPTGDEHDDNWLSIAIRVRVGGFSGKLTASILTGELSQFLTQLRPLHETLLGSAEFRTLEQQLSLRLTGDGRGGIEMLGEIADQPGGRNHLHFRLEFDQTQLGRSLSELERVCAAFPIR